MSCDLRRYMQLVKQRPELFENNGGLTVVTDPARIEAFVRAGGRQIGVAYESDYSLLAVDLVQDQNGRLFTYERLIPANTGAIVSVPLCGERFVLLWQYRHALRDHQFAFPRGFGEPGLPARENLDKEIAEELGAQVCSASWLGRIAPDSGMSSSLVDVYACRITEPSLRQGYEGIRKICLMDRQQLQQAIARREITDGFTLAAFALYVNGPQI